MTSPMSDDPAVNGDRIPSYVDTMRYRVISALGDSNNTGWDQLMDLYTLLAMTTGTTTTSNNIHDAWSIATARTDPEHRSLVPFSELEQDIQSMDDVYRDAVIAAASGTGGEPGAHTGGMVALVPTAESAVQLAVAGGLPAGELHVTLCYLGDDVTGWPPEITAAVNNTAETTSGFTGPLTLQVFAWSQFNPNGGPGGQEPCMVYQFSGDGDYTKVAALAGTTQQGMKEAIGEAFFPEQYARFEPHLTAGYGISPTALSYTGPVTFDRLRVALGGNITDYPLGETAPDVTMVMPSAALKVIDDSQREAITAAALALVDKVGAAQAYATAPLVFPTPALLTVADSVIELPTDDDAITASATTELPTLDMFTPPPDMPPGTGHYVDGRHVYGRLAEWNTPHIGIDGRKVYPPRSPSGYRWFHTKTARVQGPHGPERIKIGHLTFGTGHAGLGLGHLAAASHYDNSGYRGAKIRISEDGHGIVYSGALVAGIEGARLEEFEESDTSGDWRMIMGNLELVAALCVNVGGYPKVGLSLASSGEPYALVASAKSWGQAATIDYDQLADTIADRVIQRHTITAALTAQRDTLIAALDDTEERTTDLLADLYHNDIPDDDTALTAANWVEKAGGLPQYIKRIAKHLTEKGMDQSRAIATAVNAAKKSCASGDTNFPGVQHVNPGSRAEACAAVADWERKKAQSHAG
jgi:hypothetical protein